MCVCVCVCVRVRVCVCVSVCSPVVLLSSDICRREHFPFMLNYPRNGHDLMYTHIHRHTQAHTDTHTHTQWNRAGWLDHRNEAKERSEI